MYVEPMNWNVAIVSLSFHALTLMQMAYYFQIIPALCRINAPHFRKTFNIPNAKIQFQGIELIQLIIYIWIAIN